jgi:hypothetical protein
MAEPTYPSSIDVVAQTANKASEVVAIRADALYFGSDEDNAKTLGDFLGRYSQGMTLEILGIDQIRISYSARKPPTVMVNGYMLQATTNVDTPAHTGASGTYYVMAVRTAASLTFTTEIRSSAVEGTDERVVGEFYWDGAEIAETTIVSYELEGSALTNNSPMIIKAWGNISSAGAINDSEGIDSCNLASFDYTITWENPFKTTSYAVVAIPINTANGDRFCTIKAITSTSVTIQMHDDAGGAQNDGFTVIAIGELA